MPHHSKAYSKLHCTAIHSINTSTTEHNDVRFTNMCKHYIVTRSITSARHDAVMLMSRVTAKTSFVDPTVRT